MYGDTVLQVDYTDVESAWRTSDRPAIMTVLRNLGQSGPSNADFHTGLVVAYEKEAPRPDMQWIDYGMGGLATQALSLAPAGARDLATLHTVLAAKGLLAGYEVTRALLRNRDAGLARRDHEVPNSASLLMTIFQISRSGRQAKLTTFIHIISDTGAAAR